MVVEPVQEVGLSADLIDKLKSHSETLLKARKELKAPDSYPKKGDLAKFGRKNHTSLNEFKDLQAITHLDYDPSGKQLLAIGHLNDK